MVHAVFGSVVIVRNSFWRNAQVALISWTYCGLFQWLLSRFPWCLNFLDIYDLKRWPVTATRTGVTYKNIFCSICHGVLHNDSITPDLEVNGTLSNDMVDFWWRSVVCEDKSAIEKILGDEELTAASLDRLVNERWVVERAQILGRLMYCRLACSPNPPEAG